MADERPFPDGIADRNLAPRTPLHRHASPLSLILLAGLLLVALIGMLGGRVSPTRAVDTPAVRLEVQMPAVARNGIFFESRIRVTPHRPFRDLRIAVSPSLWRDITQNTMIPAAGEEGFGQGYFTFAYGPHDAGEAIEVKADFQINPSLVRGTHGEVAVFDGETRVAVLPLVLAVRP